ncbi:hypothetical protein KAF25_006920 [Fusarium avenaceum]|uniref:Uncharacterized protein n=1 Tax=Fusarium avenaceum TaxID=40199 RepID=A0A9P7GW62_9HYPO|nr:hypothetical protein KAF25_006920 [Fusarium avenaceum]
MTSYPLGDAYQDEKRDQVLRNLGKYSWSCETKDYLSYVKYMAPRWPHLQVLVDFMEVGTIPTRWCRFPEEKGYRDQSPRYTYPREESLRLHEQSSRSSRVNVALLQYKAMQKPDITRFESRKSGLLTSKQLERSANDIKIATETDQFNLFVVEDLSRNVIEILGSTFGIDPQFFRAHITEHVWNNVRDRWRDPSVLDVDARRRDWFQMRFMRSRYFAIEKDLHDAEKETNEFNIIRRIIADDNDTFWDRDPKFRRNWWPWGSAQRETTRVDAKVGLMRSRATFWLSPDLPVGVLLLDPTPKAGYPLWRGYGNWDNIPPFENHLYAQIPTPHDDIPPSQRRKQADTNESWFEEYLYWAQRSVSVVKSPDTIEGKLPSIPIQSLLHLICGDWLIFADYLKTRLNQIDWAIVRPSFFPKADTDTRQQSLDKLHFWRRTTPQARDMLNNCVRQTFTFKRHPSMAQLIEPYDYDYKAVAERLNEHERRIDRLSSAVNSAISLDDAGSTSNLTILASIFIPPGLIATLLSMNTDPLVELFPALKWWAIVSTTVATVIVGVLLGLGSVHGWLVKLKSLLPKLSLPTLETIISVGNKKQKWKTNSMV